jgi:transcriptional regulator with XRE-family HTH domain
VDRQAVHDFLVSRRARITPEHAGLPTYGEKRRVPGLRREEVASLAGVSFDYYARLERGNLSGVSDSVLEALARALQLDEAEKQHLFDLAKAASVPASRSRPAKPAVIRVRPAVLSILNGMTGTPAYVRNARLDILAVNDLCLALYDGVLARDDLPFNLARFVFLDPYAKAFFLDWDTRWARHDVRLHHTARKRLANRVVGEIELTGDALGLAGDRLTMIAYSAAGGSQAEDQLKLLAAWSAPARTAAPERASD